MTDNTTHRGETESVASSGDNTPQRPAPRSQVAQDGDVPTPGARSGVPQLAGGSEATEKQTRKRLTQSDYRNLTVEERVRRDVPCYDCMRALLGDIVNRPADECRAGMVGCTDKGKLTWNSLVIFLLNQFLLVDLSTHVLFESTYDANFYFPQPAIKR